MKCLPFTFSTSHVVFFQEHLAVMGIPAFQCLAQHTPYPPFDVDGLSPGIQKKIAGNDS